MEAKETIKRLEKWGQRLLLAGAVVSLFGIPTCYSDIKEKNDKINEALDYYEKHKVENAEFKNDVIEELLRQEKVDKRHQEDIDLNQKWIFKYEEEYSEGILEEIIIENRGNR